MSIPEGATHKAVGTRIDCWYKNINFLGFEFMKQGGSEWLKRDGMPNWPYERIANEQPKPWSGPEDGLPQVNTECEVVEGPAHWDDRDAEWLGTNVKVRSSFINDLGQSIVAVERFDGRCSCFIIECLVVTKTPEQQVAEQRETAIRELMDIAQVDCRVTAARLVDAGFKLPSKSGEDREQGISDLRDHIAHANFRRSPNSGDEELAKQLYGAGFRRERTPDNPFR